MLVTSDETRIQTFADWPISRTKRMLKDNRQNPEDVVVPIYKKTAGRQKLPCRNSWPNLDFSAGQKIDV